MVFQPRRYAPAQAYRCARNMPSVPRCASRLRARTNRSTFATPLGLRPPPLLVLLSQDRTPLHRDGGAYVNRRYVTRRAFPFTAARSHWDGVQLRRYLASRMAGVLAMADVQNPDARRFLWRVALMCRRGALFQALRQCDDKCAGYLWTRCALGAVRGGLAAFALEDGCGLFQVLRRGKRVAGIVCRDSGNDRMLRARTDKARRHSGAPSLRPGPRAYAVTNTYSRTESVVKFITGF